MLKVISKNEYDRLIRENSNLKSENADLKTKLDQFESENNANNEYESGGYCSVCKNSYLEQPYSAFYSYGCILKAKCKHFSKKENDDKR